MKKKKKVPGSAATDPGEVSLEETPENRNYYSRKQPKRQAGRCHKLDEQPVRRPAYWAVLPAEIRYDAELPDKAKLLYAEISSLTSETGFCWATNAYFCRLFEMADRTLQRNLRALEAKGYIKIQDGDGGSKTRKIYAGVNPLSIPPTKMSGGPDKNVGGTPDKNVGGNNNKKENQEKDQNTPKPPKGAASEIWDPEAFERFWKLYPKKKDKAKAIQEWNKLKADRKLMKKMSAALGAQMASEEWQRDNGRAIPYPCRWLSHRRWEDELSVSVPAPKPAEEVQREWI